MFHVDVASAYVAMRRIPYKIINECHSKCFAAILVESAGGDHSPTSSGASSSSSSSSSSFVSFVSIVRIFGVNIK